MPHKDLATRRAYRATRIEHFRKMGRAGGTRYRVRYPDRIKATREARKAQQQLDASLLRTERHNFLIEAKAKPCDDCGRIYPSCAMDFHHRDASTKDRKVARGLRLLYSLPRVVAEIEKCDVLCANCHRIREWSIRRLGRAA